MAHARKNEVEQGIASSHQFLSFMLAGDEYGVEILKVQEIRGWEKVRPLPEAPNFVCGVMSLRGEVVLIIDLRKRFGMPAQDYSSTTVVIIVRDHAGDGEPAIGLVVDAVSDVYAIDDEDMREAPQLGDGVRAKMLHGVAMVGEHMVFVLDLGKLVTLDLLEGLTDPERARAEE